MSKIIPETIDNVQVPIEYITTEGLTLEAIGLAVVLGTAAALKMDEEQYYHQVVNVFGKENVEKAEDKLVELGLAELQENEETEEG